MKLQTTKKHTPKLNISNDCANLCVSCIAEQNKETKTRKD